MAKEGLLSKTKRRMKELWYGDKTYLPGHKKPKVQKQQQMKKTARTIQTSKGLKAAGLSDEEIARFMPRKKK